MVSTVLIFITLAWISISQSTNDWDLPVFPSIVPSSQLGTKKSDKLIPRHLWMAVKSLETPLYDHTKALIARNPDWETHVCSNDMKDEFMNKTFAGTSFLWAYHMLHPVAGAAKADLWRYAVLWTYGGVYIDDDSDMKKPLDLIIESQDSLIVSYENNGFNGNRCYIPTYKLSDFMAYKNEKLRDLHIFNDYVLLNWAFFSAPRHPIIAQTMINAVEIIRAEYKQEPVMRHLKHDPKWSQIMCSTGPSLLTGSAREVLFNENATADSRTTSYDMSAYPIGTKIPYKLAYRDFKEYGGKFKAIYLPVRKNPDHYFNNLKYLLSSYLPEKPISEQQLKLWQGHAIQGQNEKEIFVVDNLKKRGIPNYDTFMALKFSMDVVIVISDHMVRSIPTGDPMPAMDYTG